MTLEPVMSIKRLKELIFGSGGGSTAKPFMVTKPLVLMFEQDGKTICHIHPAKGYDHQQYGLLICDLVRHISRAFHVDENYGWEWVDKERSNPTTEITQRS